jgi:hypothetical protein
VNKLSWRHDYAFGPWLVVTPNINSDGLNRNFHIINLSVIQPNFTCSDFIVPKYVQPEQTCLERERRLFWPLKPSNVEFICQEIDQPTDTSPFMGPKICSETGRQDRSPAAWSMAHQLGTLIYAYQRQGSDNTASNTLPWRRLDGCSELSFADSPTLAFFAMVYPIGHMFTRNFMTENGHPASNL